MQHLLTYIINPLMLIIPILLAVAFLTLLERKLLGYMQLRKGPNLVGPLGLLQPIADGIKLFTKEPIRPLSSSNTLFLMMPTTALTLALIIWAPMPMPQPLTDLNLSFLFMLAVSALMVYTILWSGWSSNSKYALLGALRAVAQTISYEVTLGIILLSTLMLVGNFSMTTLIYNTKINLNGRLPSWDSYKYMWITFSTLSPESQTAAPIWFKPEWVKSGTSIGALMVGMMHQVPFLPVFSSSMCKHPNNKYYLMPLNPYPKTYPQKSLHSNLMLKTTMLTLIFLWIRASYPRFRYDQLMHLVWKNFLPMTLATYLLCIAIPIMMAGTPPTQT
uniref:NADH-ubiquinone oxidoreductase chain 1 n=1 Tax=Goniurosaurus luii TaxID=427908 RepID=A0A0A7JTD6_9SAUR|nr:NADH dehydrogenase subunit 1 [Goniurosaurus luii]AIZ35722.1 NADH dehydrogenase subunit 1 [Goniurosaurus luii]